MNSPTEPQNSGVNQPSLTILCNFRAPSTASSNQLHTSTTQQTIYIPSSSLTILPTSPLFMFIISGKLNSDSAHLYFFPPLPLTFQPCFVRRTDLQWTSSLTITISYKSISSPPLFTSELNSKFHNFLPSLFSLPLPLSCSFFVSLFCSNMHLYSEEEGKLNLLVLIEYIALKRLKHKQISFGIRVPLFI